MFYDVFKGICEGVAASRKEKNREKDRQQSYESLTTTPFLYGSDELSQLCQGARKKQEYECILDHLYRFDEVCNNELLELDNYKKIEQNIIDRYWR